MERPARTTQLSEKRGRVQLAKGPLGAPHNWPRPRFAQPREVLKHKGTWTSPSFSAFPRVPFVTTFAGTANLPSLKQQKTLRNGHFDLARSYPVAMLTLIPHSR